MNKKIRMNKTEVEEFMGVPADAVQINDSGLRVNVHSMLNLRNRIRNFNHDRPELIPDGVDLIGMVKNGTHVATIGQDGRDVPFVPTAELFWVTTPKGKKRLVHINRWEWSMGNFAGYYFDHADHLVAERFGFTLPTQ